jgi:hypothetical protein
VLDQNIFLITQLSNTFNLCSSVKIGGQVSHPYAISGVIIVLSSNVHPNITLFADISKIDVQKSTSSIGNSTFSLVAVFNTQTVRHVLKTLAIFSVYLRQMHYVFQESITSAILQYFISITCQQSSPSVKNYVKFI